MTRGRDGNRERQFLEHRHLSPPGSRDHSSQSSSADASHSNRSDESWEDVGRQGQTDERDQNAQNDRDDRHDRHDRHDTTYGGNEMANWTGQASIKGSRELTQMVLLTVNAIGIAFTWSIEMTYCTPYLLKLGLTKSNTSLIWVAGPLSGLIVQPIVGAYADGSTSRLGRRRPVMIIGAIIVVLCLLLLGFTRELVDAWSKGATEETAQSRTITLAVIAIYFVDFAINAVMSCARSLVVDILPVEKQQTGAAWASRMSAVGHMLGYAAGALDMVNIFGTTMGDTQFKQLTIVSAGILVITTATTCFSITERVLVSGGPAAGKGRFKVITQIWSRFMHLPPRIQAICWAQFWSWIGWFPFLFYGTTWIGEVYFRYDLGPDDQRSKDALGEMGRIGSTSMVIYSFITFLGAFLLPLVVQSPEERASPFQVTRTWRNYKPDLLTAWMGGHILFSTAMILAPFAHGYRFATFLVCLCGLPWALAMWAPPAFLGVEVNRMSGNTENGAPAYRRLSNDLEVEMSTFEGDTETNHLRQDEDASSTPDSSTGELSGIYFGILNIYTTLPQFIGTGISAIVFAIFEPGKSPELAGDPEKEVKQGGTNAISVCLFLGAISTAVAIRATQKLRNL